MPHSNMSYIGEGGASGKEPALQCKRCKRHRFNPWVGKIPGEGNGNPLQYSCLGSTMDRGAWWATIHGVAKSGPDLATKQHQRPMRCTQLTYSLTLLH